MLKTYFLIQVLFIVAISEISNAQNTNTPGTCGTDNIIKQLRKESKFREREKQMNREIQSAPFQFDVSYTLPLVFHIISEDPFYLSDQNIQDAVKDLNDAFGKTGNYASGRGVDTKIRFCLAVKDPDGGNSTGITRTKSFFGTDLNKSIEDNRLKNLVQWDPGKYVNIWVVNNIRDEAMALFECGKWTRLNTAGYATMPPGGGPTDGIVVTGFGSLLAHEMGHYLSLYHTFEGGCSNGNCQTEGDQVCDTPPDHSVAASACSNPENSCNTDIMSNYSNGYFPADVPDQVDNFMDYGNSCPVPQFTEGQAERMRTAIVTFRSGLLKDECTKPCPENIRASFVRNNPYPVPGDKISFNNTSSGAASYQWLVNDAVVETSTDFSYLFSAVGKYKVTLKAYNTDVLCYSTFTDYIIVTCGVTARFYADKKVIAAKATIMTDNIYFTNTSVNGTSYKWMVSNDAGMPETVISTATDLNYEFTTPGNYFIRLEATNGGCTDITEAYTVPVADPTPDGVPKPTTAACYEQNKIKITLSFCNNGFANLPAGTIVSFYDADPTTANAHKLEPPFIIPEPLPGSGGSDCCSDEFTHIINAPTSPTGEIYVVLNDNGSAIPLTLPNTNVPEKDYTNNIKLITSNPYSVIAIPAEAILEKGDTVLLAAVADSGINKYTWSDDHNLSCTECQLTVLTADTSTIKQVIATNDTGCTDTAYVRIIVKPFNASAVYIPNAFTPNGDNLNDFFYISGGDDIKIVKDFSIYNRWGQKVFERKNFAANDPALGWNGSYNGARAALGIYVYSATISFENNTRFVYKGTVVLLR